MFLFLLFQFVLIPFIDMKAKAVRSLKSSEKSLREIQMLRSEYISLRENSDDVSERIARRPGGFTLFAFLEQQASQAGVKSHIKHMKPSVSKESGPYKESSVEMKMEEITLKQLVDYLYRVESPVNLVKVKRISLKQNKGNENSLTALIHFVTYE